MITCTPPWCAGDVRRSDDALRAGCRRRGRGLACVFPRKGMRSPMGGAPCQLVFNDQRLDCPCLSVNLATHPPLPGPPWEAPNQHFPVCCQQNYLCCKALRAFCRAAVVSEGLCLNLSRGYIPLQRSRVLVPFSSPLDGYTPPAVCPSGEPSKRELLGAARGFRLVGVPKLGHRKPKLGHWTPN